MALSSWHHASLAGARKVVPSSTVSVDRARIHRPFSRVRKAVCHVISDRPAVRTQPASDVASEASDLVDWRNAWYAVQPFSELPRDRPYAITILGKELVVWLDGDKQWRVFEDSCPHRKVALSEGRIEDDGTLSCAYHGWRFKGDGNCTTIPQLPDEPSRAERIASSPLACATAFPSEEAEGMLWVWMDSSPEGFQLSASTPLPSTDAEADITTSPWFVRDLPMSWEILIENINDPSHVPFSHHNVQGNRERVTKPSFDVIDMLGKSGYIAKESMPRAGAAPGRLTRNRLDHSKLPSRYDMCIDVALNSDQKTEPPPEPAFLNAVKLRTHPVPVTKTWSRMAMRVEYKGVGDKMKKAVKRRPAWHDHLERNDIFDGDGIFLHKQDALMQQGMFKPRDYFTPAPCDKGVLAFWDFMKKHAPNGINYYPHDSEPKVLPREEVLDRYNQHTKNCKACSSALKTVQVAQWVAVGSIAACVCAAVVLLARGYAMLSLPMGAAVVVAVAAMAAIRALKKFGAKFTFVDYVHAER